MKDGSIESLSPPFFVLVTGHVNPPKDKMSDTPSQTNSPDPAATPAPGEQAVTSAETKTTDTTAVPYERFKEINDQFKAAKVELDRLAAEATQRTEADKKAKERQLAQEQKWQQLATERETERDTANRLLADTEALAKRQAEALQKFYDARKAAVPEMYRPLLDKLDIVERLEWIAEYEPKLVQTTRPNGIPATPQAQGQGEISVEERRRRSQRTF